MDSQKCRRLEKPKVDGGWSRNNILVSEATRTGLIVKAQSGFFTVEMSPRRHGDAGLGLVVCQLRGKLKQGRARGDIAAVGDKVRITVLPDGSGVIEEVEKRKSAIVRLDTRNQGDYP